MNATRPRRAPGAPSRPEGASPPAGPDTLALARRFEALMVRIGRLNYAWTNTESVLVEVLARIMGSPVRVAAVVFLTLNTTRARLDLAERLARLDNADHTDLIAVLRRFRKLSRLRNKLNHSVYDVNETTGTLSTQATRVLEGKDGIEFGLVEPLGDADVRRIDTALEELRAINSALWSWAGEEGPAPQRSAA